MSDLDDLDDFDLDDLDMDMDFDDNPEVDTTNRSPVERIAQGAVESLSDPATGIELASTIARNSIPRGYDSAFTSVDRTISQTKRLYDQAKDQIKGPLDKLKKTVHENVDKLPSIVSDDLKSRIKDFTETDESLAEGKRFDPDTEGMNATLNSIFTLDAKKEEASLEQEKDSEVAKLDIKEAESQLQNKFQSEQAISSKITYQWQRKSLELQHRQYFLARDTLAVIKADAADAKTARSAIAKNTALPDFLKLRATENFTQIMQTRALGDAQEKVSGQLMNYGSRLAENIGNRINEASSMLGSGVDSLDQMLSMLGDDTMDGLAMAGGMAAESGLGALGSKASERLSKAIEENPELMERLAGAEFEARNAAFTLEDRLSTYDGFGGDLLRSILPSITGNNTGVRNTLADTATEPALFDNLTHRTVNEVIPGYLARMLRELMASNGIENPPLIAYSTTGEKFTTRDKASRSLREKIFKSEQRENDAKLNELADIYDPDGNMSERQRDALKRRLAEGAKDKRWEFRAERYAKKGQELSKEDMARANALSGEVFQEGSSRIQEDLDAIIKLIDPDAKMSAKEVDELSQSILKRAMRGNERFDINEFRSEEDKASNMQRLEASKLFNSINDSTDIQKEVNAAINRGDRSLLEDIGVIGEGRSLDEVVVNEDIIASYTRNKAVENTHIDVTEEIARNAPMAKNKPVGNITYGDVTANVDTSAMEQLLVKLDTSVKGIGSDVNLNMKDVVDNVSAVPVRVVGGGLTDNGSSNEPPLNGLLTDGFKVITELLASIDAKTGLTEVPPGIGAKAAGLASSVFKGAPGLIGGYFSGVTKLTGALTGGVASIVGMGAGALGGGLGKALSMGRRGRRRAKDFISDIYVRGQAKPILEAAKLRAGKYYDSVTGKVITSFEDIKNGVKDEDGNWVLSADDVKNYLYDNKGTDITGMFKALASPFTAAINFQTNAFNHLMKAPGAIKNLGIKAIEYVGDAYVPGEKVPRLLSMVMKNGGYISAATGKVITKLSEIDGDVLDRNGNIVLSLEEFRHGLFKRNGLKINLDSTLSKIKGLVGGGLNVAKNVVMSGVNFGKATVKTAGNFVGGLVGGLTSRVSSGNTAVTADDAWTKRIYQHMVDRWPLVSTDNVKANAVNGTSPLEEPLPEVDDSDNMSTSEKLDEIDRILDEHVENLSSVYRGEEKKVAGDADGDGVRDGSIQDIMNKRRANKQDGNEDEAIPEANEKEGGGLLSKLARAAIAIVPLLTAGFSAITGAIGTAVTTLGGLLSARKGAGLAGDAMDMASGSDGKSSKTSKGKGSKLGRLAKGAGRLALGAGKMAGGLAMGAGKLALGAGAFLAKGAGAIASSSIGLPATAAIAAGYSVYKLGSFLVSRSDAEPLEAIRFLQYGINTDKSSQLAMIREFESAIIDNHINVNGNNVSFKGTVEKIREAYAEDIFDVDMDSSNQVSAFDVWFAMRFMPVFMTHMGAITMIDPDVDLTDIDDEIEDEHVIHFLNKAMLKPRDFGNGEWPLGITASPFPGVTSTPNTELIKKTANMLMEEFKEDSAPGTLALLKKRVKKSSRHNEESSLGLEDKDASRIVGDRLTHVDKSTKQKVPKGFKVPDVTKQLTIEGERKSGSPNMIMPVEGGRISSPFGPRVHPILGSKGKHKGIDIAAPTGTPVYSPADGTIYRQYHSDTYGKVIYLKHKDGTASRYAHLHAFAEGTDVGVDIAQGQLLGYVGNTGRSSGPHLHWEVRRNTDQYAPVIDPLTLVNNQLKRKAQAELKATEQSLTKGKEDAGYEKGDVLEGTNTVGVTTQMVKENQRAGNIVIDKAVRAKDKETKDNINVIGKAKSKATTASAAPAIDNSNVVDQLRMLNDVAKQQDASHTHARAQRDVMIQSLEVIKELLADIKIPVESDTRSNQHSSSTSKSSVTSNNVDIPVPMNS